MFTVSLICVSLWYNGGFLPKLSGKKQRVLSFQVFLEVELTIFFQCHASCHVYDIDTGGGGSKCVCVCIYVYVALRSQGCPLFHGRNLLAETEGKLIAVLVQLYTSPLEGRLQI